MFNFRKKKKTSPGLKRIYDKILSLINNEDTQNEMAPVQIRDKIINGIDCDSIPYRSGKFGYEISNPIPVNGVIGEEIYLSNLIAKNGERIMFHRLGSTEKIDIYETVTSDGKIWDILFLDMYHPRKSRISPEGYQLLNNNCFFTGINIFCDKFPSNLYDLIFERTSIQFGVPLPLKDIKALLENMRYSRPNYHIQKIKNLNIESLNLKYRNELDR